VLRLTWTRTYCYFYYSRSRGVTRGVRGTQFPGRRKVPTMSQVLSSVHLLPKDLILEHGGAKLASCHGCNLTLLRPWAEGIALLYKRPSQSGPREKFIAHPWLRSFVWRYGQPPPKKAGLTSQIWKIQEHFFGVKHVDTLPQQSQRFADSHVTAADVSTARFETTQLSVTPAIGGTARFPGLIAAEEQGQRCEYTLVFVRLKMLPIDKLVWGIHPTGLLYVPAKSHSTGSRNLRWTALARRLASRATNTSGWSNLRGLNCPGIIKFLPFNYEWKLNNETVNAHERWWWWRSITSETKTAML